MKKIKSFLLKIGLSGVVASLGYWFVVRPWHLTWGTTESESDKKLPGDDLIPNPKLSSTRAITLPASPAEIWPWLLQIGQDRGGFYGTEWIEKLLSFQVYPNQELVPELQKLTVSDRILAPEMGFKVAEIEPQHYLVLYDQFEPKSRRAVHFDSEKDKEPESYIRASWVFYLQPVAEEKTRLLIRYQNDYSSHMENHLKWLVPVELLHFFVEREMLLNLKDKVG